MKQHFQSKPTLRLLFWETTIKCNLACAHCRRVEGDEAADKDLSTAQAKELIEQLADLGKRQPMMPVLVFSGGEPLCRGDLFELVGQAKSLGIVPALATNGTLIDATVAGMIKCFQVIQASHSLPDASDKADEVIHTSNLNFELPEE